MAIQSKKTKSAPPSYDALGGPIGKIIFVLMIFIGIPVIRWWWSGLGYREPSEKQVSFVVNNLPADGIYSVPEVRGGSYIEPNDISFEAEIPQGYELLYNALVKPGVRSVKFKSGRREIRCQVSKPGKYEPKEMYAGARSVTIDGVEGVEEIFAVGKGRHRRQMARVTYVKYGHQHIVSVSFPVGKFPKYAEEFLTFLRSYRALVR